MCDCRFIFVISSVLFLKYVESDAMTVISKSEFGKVFIYIYRAEVNLDDVK